MTLNSRLVRHAGRALVTACAALCAQHAAAVTQSILFVGNSYTFGRVDPVMSYNAANVHDLTAGFNATSSTGSNPWEPHPWGGVPGIFKQMTVEAGLDYDVSISARNAATLRGHFLNTANAAWNLRGNVASKTWNVVVLQEQSDAALPAGQGKNANLAQFNAYANQFERFIHTGTAQTYTETQLYGSLAACTATGASNTTCGTSRTIAANPNASAATKVFLTDTWARPDMVYAHKITTPDPTSLDGRPMVDTSVDGGNAVLYYPTLAGMTQDLHAAFYGLAQSNPKYAGVIPVGDAFQRALDMNLAQSTGFYNPDGTYATASPGNLMDLWWYDDLHASKYGSYLDALVQFGTITGLDPRSLGLNELAARDLGISSADAFTLERVASLQLGFVAVPEPAPLSLMMLGMGALAVSRRRRRLR